MDHWKNLPSELQALVEKRNGERRAEEADQESDAERRISGRRKEDLTRPSTPTSAIESGSELESGPGN